MKQGFKLALIGLMVLGLLAGALAAYVSVSARGNAQAVSGIVPVMDLFDHNEVVIMNPKERGKSQLVRSIGGWQLNVDTTDLPVGAYSIWALIFNDPSMCTDGICSLDDVLPPPGNVDAGMSPLWVTGGIVGPDRQGHFSGSVGMGVEGAPGSLLWGDGLTNPMGAEVHLEVRYHGPAAWDDPALLYDQMATVGGNCTRQWPFGRTRGPLSGAIAPPSPLEQTRPPSFALALRLRYISRSQSFGRST